MSLQCEIIPVTPFAQNCSLIWDTETLRGALIDAGGEIERLQARAAHHGVTLEKLLVTHGHLDHASGVADLAEQLKLPIEGPQEGDRFWIEGLPDAAARYGFPPARSFEPTRWLQHGDRVRVGNLELEVLHCPGHTPGHVVFHHAPSQLAFVGDVIFAGSIGRTDFPRGDHQQLLDSIRQRLFPLGDAVRFVPGHGPVSSFGEERRSNPFVADARFG
ncbi:Glyoxylase, beta-lactamase superfamily II [Solimonas aquatica]|uniref:Glyoxylase, beta-lactamase superfamily II n=1 Tax=Solimonas aquatica TaxID=489703 RepID=A0A1H9LQX3_9GAMM|nr:MBL fold metallo-hydrolase [Solimonas aquatica]SER13790.1 Glyoxylase, beta-lactamase superfamily II [Solimonas aquatica]